MYTVCPTITAVDMQQYKAEIQRVESFAHRVHIDLMDGQFAPTKSPPLERLWWPHHFEVDIHLMYQHPAKQLHELIRLKPHMVIIHAEAEGNLMHFAAELHKHGIETGVALLQDTTVQQAHRIMHAFDQVLIFSGNLGRHGGHADLNLLSKAHKIHIEHPDAEIAWDGGITASNAPALIEVGVEVLNVGGFIQNAADPAVAYKSLHS